MDWSQFGMGRRPFRPAVDTGSYFPAASHEAASAAVAAAYDRRDPIVLIDGPSGIGKTLVARRWLEQLPSEVPRLLVPNAHATRPADLLQALLFDLNLPYQSLTEQELRLAVTGELLSAVSVGRPIVLLIDEAQHLSHSAIEELRLLVNLETQGASALFVVLVALPSLREALDRPAYESFAQRVAIRCRVEPFSAVESAEYLLSQVREAGGRPEEFFDSEAVAMLARQCGGVARVLNRAAALAAEMAAAGGAEVVDVEAVLEALGRLGLEPAEAGGADEPDILTHTSRIGEAPRSIRPKRKPGQSAEMGNEAQPSSGKHKVGRKKSA